MKWRIVIGAAALILVPAGALGYGVPQGSDPQSDEASKRSSRPIIVTRSEGPSRPNCGPRSIGRRLENFTSAMRRLDADSLRRFWGPGFRWLALFGRGMGDRGGSLRTYRSAVRFLRQKQRRKGGMVWRFHEIAVSGYGDANFTGQFRWGGSSRVVGIRGGSKALLSCRGPTILQMVLSAGGSVQHPPIKCPEPSESAPDNALIVCTWEDR